MREYSEGRGLDDLHWAILDTLQTGGRASHVELSRRLHLSPPAVHARVRRLEREGYIRQYVALLDRAKVGFDMLCFTNVSLQMHQLEQVERFRDEVQRMPEVLECHHVTGEYDYLLKVAIRNRRDLERFVVDRLTPVPGVARIHTSLALTEVKSDTALPLIPPDASETRAA
jgi:DNA-binding Lrp family transcriptional regulator